MKRTSLLFAAMLACVVAMAQKPVIEFSNKSYNFGNVPEDGGRVSTVFEFTNTGSVPLVLSNVRASCGCTATNWSKAPIEPGQKGSVTATYNPNGRPGKFTKTITVTSNASEPQVRLTITGEVIPKSAKPVDKYPVKMGELGLNERNVNFGDVNKGTAKSMKLEMANNSKEEMTIALAVANAAIEGEATPATLKPGEAGTIYLSYNTANSKVWGPMDDEAYVVINGKLDKSDTYRLNLRANVVEDFSKMTAAERQNAPIVKYSTTTIDLGTLKANTAKTVKLNVTNEGAKDALQIRRIVNNSKEITATTKSTAVKAGKAGVVTITVNTKDLAPQAYRRTITILSNDPDHTKQVINVNWTVE